MSLFPCVHDPLGIIPDRQCGCPIGPPELQSVRKHSHYFKDVEHLKEVDVYRVLELFSVTDPCFQHAIKKLLVAGGRGVKDMPKDVQEAIDTLERWKTMRQEDLGRSF